MESNEASRFLDTKTLLLGVAASAPTVASLPAHSDFLPTLYTLVAHHSSLLHSSQYSLEHSGHNALLRAFRSVTLEVDEHILQRIGVNTNMVTVRTVADYVIQMFKLALRSPNHLYFILDLIDSQTDPTYYHQHSLVSLFLRKIVIAFHSLNFEAVSKVFDRVHAAFGYLVNSTSLGNTDDNKEEENERRHIEIERELDSKDENPYELVNHISSVIMHNHQHENFNPLLSPHNLIKASDAKSGGAGNISSILKQYYIHFYSMLMFKDSSVSFDFLHKYFDQIQYHQLHDSANSMKEKEDKKHEYTILGLSMTYIQLNNIRNALCSLKDCLRYSNLLNDQTIRRNTLKWLSYIECRNVSKKHLLYMHANDVLSLKFHLFHTVFTPISIRFDYSIMKWSALPGTATDSTGNNGDSSSSNRNHLYNRMRMIVPVNLNGDGSNVPHGKEEQIKKVILSTYIKMELGDLLNAKTNIEIAMEVCKMHNINYLYIQAKILHALIYFELGDLSHAISLLSAHVNHDNSTPSQSVLVNTLLPTHHESIHFTLVYLRFIRALRRGHIRQCEQYKRMLKSYSSMYVKQSQQQLRYKQVVLNYMECEILYHNRVEDFGQSYGYMKVYMKRNCLMSETKNIIKALLHQCDIIKESQSQVIVQNATIHLCLKSLCLSQGFGIEHLKFQTHLALLEATGDNQRASDYEQHDGHHHYKHLLARRYLVQVQNKLGQMVNMGRKCSKVLLKMNRLVMDIGVMFSQCEDLKEVAKCWHLIAVISDMLGEKKKRRYAARRFNEITRRFATLT